MMAPNLRRLSRRLWAKREAKCLSIIERALTMLFGEEDLPVTEIELNRLLYFHLLRASRELYPEDVIPPVTECNNQPDPDDQARALREYKRPDFQWIYLDIYEPDPDRSSRHFVVECKRLGDAPRTDWVLNTNYVEYGVRRFLEPEWAYAKGAPSGAMVGYWQSMLGEDVLREVNAGCRLRSIPRLVPIGPSSTNGVGKFNHDISRTFPASPFRLHHLWIDLRP